MEVVENREQTEAVVAVVVEDSDGVVVTSSSPSPLSSSELEEECSDTTDNSLLAPPPTPPPKSAYYCNYMVEEATTPVVVESDCGVGVGGNAGSRPTSARATSHRSSSSRALVASFSPGSLFNLQKQHQNGCMRGYIQHNNNNDDDNSDDDDDGSENEGDYHELDVIVDDCIESGKVAPNRRSNFYHPGSPAQYCTQQQILETRILSTSLSDKLKDCRGLVKNEAEGEYTDMTANIAAYSMYNGVSCFGGSDKVVRDCNNGKMRNGHIVGEEEMSDWINHNHDTIPSTPPPLPPTGVPPLRLKRFRRSLSQRSTKKKTEWNGCDYSPGTPMGFGTELQGRQSHEALLRLQDAEIRLLDVIKKCLSQRIKCDRDYAQALSVMVSTANKVDNAEFSSPVFQAWNEVINETSTLAATIKENADTLSADTMEKLAVLISEKRACRKHYAEERHRLEAEFQKLHDEVTRSKSEYEKQLTKVAQERTKYEEVQAKGKTGSKLDDAKSKFVKSTAKAHKSHNDYVCALHEASIHQKAFIRTTLPCLLDHQQSAHEMMVEQSKQVLQEYASLTNTNDEKFSTCHRSIQKKTSLISPQAEYDDFLNKYKGDPISALKFEFDADLLAEYKGNLTANEIALNDLTADNLNISNNIYRERVSSCEQSIAAKREELAKHQAELDGVTSLDSLDITQKAQYSMHKRSVMMLTKEITELGCQEEKWQLLHDLLNSRLESNPTPPLAVVFDENGVSPTAENGVTGRHDTSVEEESGSGLISNKFNTMKTTFASVFKNKQGTSNPPKPPSKDFLDTSKVNGATMKDSPEKTRDGYQELPLQPGRGMDEEEWYHGVLPRDEVQRLLVNDGDYLVRQSNNRKTGEVQYVLSVFWNGHKHFIIQGGDGQWRFEGDAFPSIQELIINQHKSGTPVTKRSEAILRKPIHREKWELFNDDVELGMKIGDGNFGCVYKGNLKSHTVPVAIKTCKETLSDDMKKKFLQEGRILKQYDHENIVRFIGIAATRQPVMIVMEYVPGGALSKYLRKHGQNRSSKQMVRMCADAAAGMAYLESKNCIHRDLAARNCLVGDDDVVKISDFGMSREEEEYTVSGGLKQIPIKWTAPEALHFARYTSACDVWSYGILMWEIFSLGNTPYPGLTNSQAREKIDEGYRMPAPDNMPAALSAIMSKCWEAEANDRPRFEEIYKNLLDLVKKA